MDGGWLRAGQGFHFDGWDGAIRVPDAESLRFTNSVTITAWVKVLSYPSPGRGVSQFVFRGDDRSGKAPYSLGVEHDGMLAFTINSGSGATTLRAPIPLDRFVHVAASLDDATGWMSLRFNGERVAEVTTAFRPFRDSDPGAHRGIGIGNQAARPDSAFNQPFYGVIDEVTISG